MALAASKNIIRPASGLLDQIGNTPLLRLAKLNSQFSGVEIYAKAEFFNPGGSVKDRAAHNMILDGERSGRLTREYSRHGKLASRPGSRARPFVANFFRF